MLFANLQQNSGTPESCNITLLSADIQADFWACVGKSPQNAAVHAPFPEKGQTSPIAGCGKFSSGDGKSV